MKRLLCLISAAVSVLLITGASRLETLTTSGDPTRYSVFTASGDRITARGYYEGDTVVVFKVTATSPKTTVDLKTYPDGTYEAVFEGSTTDDYGYICITIESGNTTSNASTIMYRVDYDNGWYFSDYGGIADKNAFFTENFSETDPSVVRMYLVNEDGDDGELTRTLSAIQTLSDEIAGELDGDYEKARAITKWVAENIYYDYAARDLDVTPDTIALDHVLDEKKTVCAGYANLTAALLEAAGLKAVTIIGAAVSLSEFEELPNIKRHHEWTAFYYEEESRWVIMDSGWDSGNLAKGGKYYTEIVLKKYFDISPLAFSQNHRADRAEHRDYFSAELYNPPETSAAVTETQTETTTLTDVAVITASTESHGAEAVPGQGKPLYAAIAALSAGIAVVLIILIRNKLK